MTDPIRILVIEGHAYSVPIPVAAEIERLRGAYALALQMLLDRGVAPAEFEAALTPEGTQMNAADEAIRKAKQPGRWLTPEGTQDD